MIGADDGLHDLGETILLEEECLVAGKRRLDRGGIRIATRTESRTEVARIALEDVAVEVERVPQGRFVAAAEGPRVEEDPDGEVTILPVYEERQVVETRLWLVEEVRIIRRRTRRAEDVPVELRRQVAVVERLEPHTEPAST